MFGRLTYYFQRFILKRLISEQRRYFDNILVPRYAVGGKRILFIGIEWYNRWIFHKYKAAQWVSIDPFESNRKFGAKDHLVGKFPDDINIEDNVATFDVVFCNGVYGWGVNSETGLEYVMQNITSILKPNGICIFGYNTAERNNPVAQETLFNIITRSLILENKEQVRITNETHDKHIFCILRKAREMPR